MANGTILIDWMLENNVSLDCVELNEETDNRYVVARRDIQKGETLLSVPISMVLDRRTAVNALHREFPEFVELAIESSICMTVFLLLEQRKGESSHYFPYIITLPAEFFDLPHYFSPELMEMAAGTIVAQKVLEIKSHLNEYLKKLAEASAKFKSLFTREQFEWAYWCVNSRAFIAQYASGGQYSPIRKAANLPQLQSPLLVPLIDMCNHTERNPSKTHLSADGESFELVAVVPISQGEPIEISYGKKSNGLHFVQYGFLRSGNVDYGTYLTLGDVNSDQQLPTQINISLFDGSSIINFFKTMRKNIAREDVEIDQAIGKKANNVAGIVNLKQEKALHAMVVSLVDLNIKRFHGELSEAEEALQSIKINSVQDLNKVNLLTCRVMEAQILLRLKRLSQQVLLYLHKPVSEAVIEIDDNLSPRIYFQSLKKFLLSLR